MACTRDVTKLVVDILCLGLVFLPWMCIQWAATPYRRGFFCDDESISHPYKDSTISSPVLGIVGLGLPIVCFLIIEGVLHANHKRTGTPDPAYIVGDKQIPFLVYQYYKVIGVFIFWAAFQQSVVSICKYSVGRLRPHFLAVCKPDYSMFNCTNSRGEHVYITGDYCTGTDEHKSLEMRLSFLSGHASFSCYALLYLAFYFHARFTWKGSKMLCPLLQCTVIMMAIYCCLSRISDYKHHWSDVLAGAVLGSFIACIAWYKGGGQWISKTRNPDRDLYRDYRPSQHEIPDIHPINTMDYQYEDNSLLEPQML